MNLPQVDWPLVLESTTGFVDFMGDLITCVIGIITLVGLIKYRKKLSMLFRVMRLNHLNDRKDEIKQTLDLIRAAQIPKGKAVEVRALFGRLNGQMLPLCDLYPEFKNLQIEVDKVAHGNGKLNETIKQQLIHQIAAQFDSFRVATMNEAAGDGR